MSRITYPSGRTVNTSYRADGTLSQLRTTYAGVTQTVLSQLTWNPSGQLTKLRFGNALVEHRSYDLAGQLTQLNRVGIGKLDYAYDLSGNITQIGTERYSYDSLDRLLQAQGAAPRRYSYDANGNRTASDASPYVLAVDSNRLLQGSARVYDYDAAGNPLSDGRYSYTYDSPGRLTEVRQGATVRQRNTYNALGQRVRKEAAGPADGGLVTNTVTHYLYSTDGQLLAELDSSGNTLREYLYLQSWPVAVVDYPAPVAPVAADELPEALTDTLEEFPEAAETPSVDNPASAEKPVPTTRPPVSVDGRAVTVPPAGVLTYLHPDHLGTPRLATDSAKRVVWRWDSAPFGDTLPQTDPDGDGLPFTLNLRFPGQYFDAETGLHYNYFRDYDPVTGRYLESDPIGLRGGVGTYGYVENRPLVGMDPRGLDTLAIPWGWGGRLVGKGLGCLGGPGGFLAATLAIEGAIYLSSSTDCGGGGGGTTGDGCEDECQLASKYQLLKAGIPGDDYKSEHDFKDAWGGVPNKFFDICACKDGSIVIRHHGMCGQSGPTIWTDARWK